MKTYEILVRRTRKNNPINTLRTVNAENRKQAGIKASALFPNAWISLKEVPSSIYEVDREILNAVIHETIQRKHPLTPNGLFLNLLINSRGQFELSSFSWYILNKLASRSISLANLPRKALLYDVLKRLRKYPTVQVKNTMKKFKFETA